MVQHENYVEWRGDRLGTGWIRMRDLSLSVAIQAGLKVNVKRDTPATPICIIIFTRYITPVIRLSGVVRVPFRREISFARASKTASNRVKIGSHNFRTVADNQRYSIEITWTRNELGEFHDVCATRNLMTDGIWSSKLERYRVEAIGSRRSSVTNACTFESSKQTRRCWYRFAKQSERFGAAFRAESRKKQRARWCERRKRRDIEADAS